MLTAYYFAAAEPGDLIAIKPHASPVYHAIQYLLGNLSRERLLQFRSFGGLQAYPSRLKDPDGVQISTGSVGFGAVMPNFMALVRRYVEDHFGYDKPHRFLALMGDAELDEGNVWEALGEDSLQRLGHVIWMVDLNRQSLDRVVPSGRAQRIAGLLRSAGCHVIEVKYGAKLEAVFARPGGERLRERIDLMSNEEYQSLLRTAEPDLLIGQLCRFEGRPDTGLARLLAQEDPAEIGSLIADLGGHDLGKILDAFTEANTVTDRPVAIVAYTVKGWQLPIAGDPANHSRLLTGDQVELLRTRLGIERGAEFEAFPADSDGGAPVSRGAAETPGGRSSRPGRRLVAKFGRSRSARLRSSSRHFHAAGVWQYPLRTGAAPRRQPPSGDHQPGCRRFHEFRRLDPKGRGVLARDPRRLLRRKPHSRGGEMEAGPARAASGTRHLGEQPVPGAGRAGRRGRYVRRNAGAHRNPLRHVHLPRPRCAALRRLQWREVHPGGHAFGHQSESRRRIAPVADASVVRYRKPAHRIFRAVFCAGAGMDLARPRAADSRRTGCGKPVPASFHRAPTAGPVSRRRRRRNCGGMFCGAATGWSIAAASPAFCPGENVVNLFTCGAMVPLAVVASNDLAGDELFVNVINVTSPDLLHRGWVNAGRSRMNGQPASHHLEQLIPEDERHCPLVTVMDGHPHALSFLGSVFGAKTVALGVDQYGQSGSRQDLYDYYQIGLRSMVQAVVEAIG